MGLRNVITNRYTTLDMPTIWRAVREDLPRMKPDLEAMALQIDPDGESHT